MSASVILVVHDDADRDYAAGLASALAPLTTMAVPVAEGTPLRFGHGAVCVVLWGPELAARGGAWVLGLLPKNASATTVLCCTRGATPGPEFGPYGVRVAQATGDIASDAEQLRAAIGAVLSAAEALQPEGSRQRKLRPVSAAKGGAVKPGGRSARLLLRSVFGIAATLAIVAVASHQMGILRIIAAPADETPEAAHQVAGAADRTIAPEAAATLRGVSDAPQPLPVSVRAGGRLPDELVRAATGAPLQPSASAEPAAATGTMPEPPAEAGDSALSLTAPDGVGSEDSLAPPASTSDAAIPPSASDSASAEGSE